MLAIKQSMLNFKNKQYIYSNYIGMLLVIKYSIIE